MNKSLEALLRGYVLFYVNSKMFLRYNSALRARKLISVDVTFKGFHIFKGWQGFFIRKTL